MKTTKLLLCLLSFGSVLSGALFGQSSPVILPTDDPESGPPMRVIWPTEPGIRYELQESTTLQPNSWTPVDGFPSEAEALAQQHAFELEGDRRFFRVAELTKLRTRVAFTTSSCTN
jgi:hypothetical protein